MHVFVINLPRDVERRAHITRQLDRLGLSYEIVPGVPGAELSPAERRTHYDDRKAKLRHSRSLLSAEIGCALSHLRVYRSIVERRLRCALVLEDDVAVPKNLGEVLAECEEALDPGKPQVWLLSPARGRSDPAGGRRLRSGGEVLQFASGVYTSSYVVTAVAAQALLAELYPVGDVADCWNRLHRYGVVDLFVVTPAVVTQNQADFGSSTTVEYRRRVSNALTTRLAYKIRRLRCVVWESIYAPYRRWTRPAALRVGARR